MTALIVVGAAFVVVLIAGWLVDRRRRRSGLNGSLHSPDLTADENVNLERGQTFGQTGGRRL